MTSKQRAERRLEEIHRFLLGEGALDGYWFGESLGRAPYWWRTELSDALSRSRKVKGKR